MADEPRPAYVRFEARSEEDREATIAAGHYVGRDVIFAIVTPTGSRDSVERKVEDWLESVREGVKQERIPESWLHAYERSLDNFKNSRDDPENGAPIKDWPGASPAQVKMLLDMNIRTVEELAVANEETVTRIGMGGRALKQKAVIWLEQASDHGKTSEKLGALEIENKELKDQIKNLMDRLTKVEAKAKKEDA